VPRRPDAPTARRRLTRSTVSNNTASGNGGGLSVDSGTVTLIDVSIVANHVDTGQPGVPDTYGAYGGGIEIFDMHGAIAMTNVTVTANAINDAKDKNGVAPGTTGSGAGMSIEQPAGTYVNLVLAGNTASAPIAAADPANGHRCDSFLDTTATTAANLDDDSSCFQGTRAIHTDAKLGTLGDNGGGTDTVALLDGSPAIDAGDNASAPATDQRGVTRPQPAGGGGGHRGLRGHASGRRDAARDRGAARDLDAERHRQPDQPRDDVPVRVRNIDVVRLHHAERSSRLGQRRSSGRRGHRGADGRHDVPLPGCRDQRRRNDDGSRSDLHNGL